jgi:hypothetical protein
LTSGQTVNSKTVELSQLSSGEFVDIHMNLDKAICGDWKLPITVSTKFVYQLQHDSENKLNLFCENSSSNYIYVPIPNITLDAFHFLQPVRGTSLQISRQNCDLLVVLEKLAKGKCCHELYYSNPGDDRQVKGHGSCASTIVVVEAQMKQLKLKSGIL